MRNQNILYNGININPIWPPRNIEADSDPIEVPYLLNPPKLINIDVGRQLFGDDFLIKYSNFKRIYHSAEVHPSSPVLVPETDIELNNNKCPMSAPFNDGVWYDDSDNLFKMWYHAGWFDGTALATSVDGISWNRPKLDVIPGTNAIIQKKVGYKFQDDQQIKKTKYKKTEIVSHIHSTTGFNRRDGGLVWLDPFCDSNERYKMFLFFRWYDGSVWPDGSSGHIFTSADGIHWTEKGKTSSCGDNSSFFYNPFRKKYVFSIREGWPYRARAYYENTDFLGVSKWKDGEQVKWYRTDNLDQSDPLIGDVPRLYDLNAVAYESIMLGAMGIFYGPQNPVCAKTGKPKIIDLQLGYSRDGFHWHRPNRKGFISSSRKYGTWDYGYIHSSGGLCLIVGDELWFYYGAFSGKGSKLNPGETGDYVQENAMYAGASTGLAKLRRDGFASMVANDQSCELVTNLLNFSGKYMFVNAKVPNGELRLEIMDHEQKLIEPFSAKNCYPISVDGTKICVNWKGSNNLSQLIDKSVSFKFIMTNGSLFSFWMSPDKTGKSKGFLAAGGPGYKNQIDL